MDDGARRVRVVPEMPALAEDEELGAEESASGLPPSALVGGSATKTENAPAAPRKRVMIRTTSIGSAAPSKASFAGSGASSATGAHLLNNTGLGLTILQRDEWSQKEVEQREHVLPILHITMEQIDGTIKPKFSHFSQESTPAQNMEVFGHLFYEELFETEPQLKKDLFSSKPAQVLAIKLGLILSELIRLLEIQSPRVLGGIVAEMALRHIEYGLMSEHVAPFRDVMIASLKKSVTERGHKWKPRTTKAWKWAITEISTLLMEAVNQGRPKVETLNKSWQFLCEKMYEEKVARQQRGRFSSKLVSKVGSKMHAKSQTDASMAGIEEEGDKPEEGEQELAQKKSSGVTMGAMVAAYKAGGVAAVKALIVGNKEDKSNAGGFTLWQKKESMQSPEYLEGRHAVGQAFLDIFASRNAWAVKDFDFGLSPTHAVKMGEALELIVHSSTKPQLLQHKLRVLSLGHVQMGIKPEFFPHFGTALFAFLEQILGNYMMFDKATEEAWQWMWDIVIAAFTHHMVSAARLLQTVGSSWEYIETNCDINEISDRFFEHLFRIVPVLQEFFTKPKKMQRVMFIKAMDLIVRSVADTKVLEVDLKAIAMRHIKFDIRSEHLEVFGQVLLQTLGDAVGADRWDEDIESCWADIYGHIAGIFGHVISTGRNLVSKALATNSSDELRRALQITPRKKRILSALEIDVDDSVVSPIVWTITEGQLHLTDVLLKDILTIRGDREHYYYGRSLLWQKHPWICRLLVEKAPKLLPTFLNGHLWVSKYSEEGYRRVNYYVRELYGDPYVPGNWNTYNTPLGLLVSRLPSSEVAVFAHPTIQFVVDLKWEQFARLDFGLQQGLNLLNLALVTTYMQIGDTYPYASFVLSIIQLFTASLRILLFLYKSGSQFSGGHGHNYRVLGLNLLVPYLLHDIFTIISLFASVLVVFLFSQTYTANPFRWQSALDPNEHVTTAAHDYWIANHDPLALRDWATLAAFTTGLLWVQMSEAFKLSNRLSALMFAIMAVLQDVMRFILVLAVWGVGFSIMLYWLFVGHNLREGELIHEALGVDLHLSDRSDVGTVVYWVIMSCLGLTGIDAMMQANILTRVVYAVCVLTTVVVLLNLLVSTMVSTYDILQMSFHELAVQSRANLVIRAEESSSMKRRAKHFNACEFGEKVDFEDGDDGPSGGIQRVVSSRERNHPAYRVLDCIERYAGSSSPDEPFHQDDMISSATTTEDLLGVGLKHTVNHQALLRIQQEVGRLSTELCMMKAATRDDDGTGTSASGSVADPGENSDGGGVEMGENIMSADGKPMGVGSFDTAAHGKFESATGLSEAEEYVKDPLANLRDISMEELHEHGDHLSLWLVVDGVVRDVTTLLGYHPGGKEVLLEAHGKDASDLFHGSHVGPSFTIASAMWKAMPPMGRMSFSEPAVTLPGAVPSLPQATTVTHHQHHDGMPMYTPRDVELDMDV